MVTRRTLELFAGIALLVLGSVLAFGATIVHLAWALPLAELLLRRAMVEGELVAAAGIALLLVARRRQRGVVRAQPSGPAEEVPLRLAS